MFLFDEILGNVEVTILTSKVKWCLKIIVLTRWVTVFLSNEVPGDVEMTIATSIVKWCAVILVPVHRVTKQFNYKIFHHLKVAVVGGIMQRNVSLIVLAVGDTLIHRYQRSSDISPAPVRS